MLKRVHFPTSLLPYILVAPQVIITLVFFIWPAGQAVYQSFLIEDAFGISTEFVWFENFVYLATDEQYLDSFGRTIFFSICVALLSMSAALILAGFADRVIKGATTYRTLLIWPYAVAPFWRVHFGFSCSTLRLEFSHTYWNLSASIGTIILMARRP